MREIEFEDELNALKSQLTQRQRFVDFLLCIHLCRVHTAITIALNHDKMFHDKGKE